MDDQNNTTADGFDGADAYGLEDGGECLHDTPDEAIAHHLETAYAWPPPVTPDTAFGALVELERFYESGETLTVIPYRRRPKAKLLPIAEDLALRAVIDHLDSDLELGNPDGAGVATSRMRDAARAFVATVLEEYVVWVCDRSGAPREINVHESLRRSYPDLPWPGDPPAATPREPEGDFPQEGHEVESAPPVANEPSPEAAEAPSRCRRSGRSCAEVAQ